MAKFTSLTILISCFLILATIAGSSYAESTQQSPSGGGAGETRASKVRTKLSAAARKKKVGGVVRAKVEPIVTTLAPTTTAEDNQTDPGELSVPTTLGDNPRSAEATNVENGDHTTNTLPEVTTTTRVPKVVKKVSRNNNSPTQTGSIPQACGECFQEDCNVIKDTNCPNGLVLDQCSCCFVCGALEGNRCFNASLNLPYNPDVGICGGHLDCLLRSDLDPTEPREALCECRDKRIVCGNDHQTYLSECKLREAAHAKVGLLVASWSPCVSAPVITTPVENATVTIGEDVSLSCEVRSYPASVLHWEFLAEGSSSPIPLVLPGDDSGIVIVVRGGPEQIMTTSWIQIIAVNPKRQGTYYCVAKNTEGTIQTSAQVQVYKSVDDD